MVGRILQVRRGTDSRTDPGIQEPEAGRNMSIQVVIADDHALIRTSMGLMIEADGDIEVIAEAGNGREAVEFVVALVPDVILMDINMPKMNGIQATRMITAICPHVRVIGLSMYDDHDVERAMREAGAVDYISKYARMDALLAIIRLAVS